MALVGAGMGRRHGLPRPLPGLAMTGWGGARGMDCFVAALLSFTLRAAGSLIRVISARDMHRNERKFHEQAAKDAS